MNIKSQSLFLLFIGGILAFSPNHKNLAFNDVQPLRKLKQQAFKKGEFLRFDVSYGYFAAARATLEISESSSGFVPTIASLSSGEGKYLQTQSNKN